MRKEDWPQEIRKPHVYGNWRTKSEKRALSKQQRREGNSKKYLALLRKCPCVITLRVPAGEVHHLKSGPAKLERGVGMRATDKWGLPLSRDAHNDVERLGSRRELEWFQERGVADPYGLCVALWNAPQDVAVMTRIILAHRK